MRIAAIVFYFLLTMPVKVGIRLRMADGRLPWGGVRISLYGIRFSLGFHIIKDDGGKVFFACLSTGKRIPLRRPKGFKKPMLTKCFPPLRSNLKKWLRALRFFLYARIGLSDAARTALLCGFLMAVGDMLPGAKIRAVPDYRKKGYDAAFCCIATFRLGKLLLTLLLLGAAQAARSICGGGKIGNHKRPTNQQRHADCP